MIRIKSRDGVIREEDDAYILKDGETIQFEMTMMDSRRGMVRDARGQPAGMRPGFLIVDGDAATEAARIEAYRSYDTAIAERWRGPSNPPPPQPKTFANPEAALESAHGEYRAAIEQRWRHHPSNPPVRQAEPARRSEPPPTFASPEAAVAASYAEYNRTIQERWRR